MNLRFGKNKRKAISPVLATVILIAITLIAAIAIAGFVFGLFGSFTSNAQVSASVVACTGGGTANIICNLTMVNTGTANGKATTTCSLTAGGQTVTGVLTGAATTTIPSGGNAAAICTGAAFTAVIPAGAQIVGNTALSNGGSVIFSGTVST